MSYPTGRKLHKRNLAVNVSATVAASGVTPDAKTGEYVEFTNEDRQDAGVKPILFARVGDGVDLHLTVFQQGHPFLNQSVRWTSPGAFTLE